MKKIPGWIIIKYDVKPPIFLCKRCGAVRDVYLPAAVDDLMKQAEAVAQSHKYCMEDKSK